MSKKIIPLNILFVMIACICIPVSQAEIDTQVEAQEDNGVMNLDCQQLSLELIKKLNEEKLIVTNNDKSNPQRVAEIFESLCEKKEVLIQEQHEILTKKAQEEWFWTHNADKPGNKRLKNLKRH